MEKKPKWFHRLSVGAGDSDDYSIQILWCDQQRPRVHCWTLGKTRLAMRKRMILKWAESGWILAIFFLPLFDAILKDVGSQRSLVWLKREVSGPNLVPCYVMLFLGMETNMLSMAFLSIFVKIHPPGVLVPEMNVSFRLRAPLRNGDQIRLVAPPGGLNLPGNPGETGEIVRLSGCLSKLIKAYPEKAMV